MWAPLAERGLRRYGTSSESGSFGMQSPSPRPSPMKYGRYDISTTEPNYEQDRKRSIDACQVDDAQNYHEGKRRKIEAGPRAETKIVVDNWMQELQDKIRFVESICQQDEGLISDQRLVRICEIIAELARNKANIPNCCYRKVLMSSLKREAVQKSALLTLKLLSEVPQYRVELKNKVVLLATMTTTMLSETASLCSSILLNLSPYLGEERDRVIKRANDQFELLGLNQLRIETTSTELDRTTMSLHGHIEQRMSPVEDDEGTEMPTIESIEYLPAMASIEQILEEMGKNFGNSKMLTLLDKLASHKNETEMIFDLRAKCLKKIVLAMNFNRQAREIQISGCDALFEFLKGFPEEMKRFPDSLSCTLENIWREVRAAMRSYRKDSLVQQKCSSVIRSLAVMHDNNRVKLQKWEAGNEILKVIKTLERDYEAQSVAVDTIKTLNNGKVPFFPALAASRVSLLNENIPSADLQNCYFDLLASTELINSEEKQKFVNCKVLDLALAELDKFVLAEQDKFALSSEILAQKSSRFRSILALVSTLSEFVEKKEKVITLIAAVQFSKDNVELGFRALVELSSKANFSSGVKLRPWILSSTAIENLKKFPGNQVLEGLVLNFLENVFFTTSCSSRDLLNQEIVSTKKKVETFVSSMVLESQIALKRRKKILALLHMTLYPSHQSSTNVP